MVRSGKSPRGREKSPPSANARNADMSVWPLPMTVAKASAVPVLALDIVARSSSICQLHFSLNRASRPGNFRHAWCLLNGSKKYGCHCGGGSLNVSANQRDSSKQLSNVEI